MQLAHRVSLNGVQLDSIDPRIVIKGIEGGSGKETVTAVPTGAGDGTRITGKRRDSVEVTVQFQINIRRNSSTDRGQVLEAINAWAAGGGWLRVGYKPNRRLWVDEVVLPGEGDLWIWLSEYTISFRAHAIPYWMENTAVTKTTEAGTEGEGVITVAGSANAVMDVALENQSGSTINAVSITVGGKTMSFTSLGLGGSETLTIDHVITSGRNVIRIRAGSMSVLGKRTDESADDFEVSPGSCAFSFIAEGSCQMTVTCRGRFA